MKFHPLSTDKSKSGAADKTFRIKSIDLHFVNYAMGESRSALRVYMLRNIYFGKIKFFTWYK